MDIGKAFTFIFEDPDWLKKVAIGTVLTLLGIIFFIVLIGLIPLIIGTGLTLLGLLFLPVLLVGLIPLIIVTGYTVVLIKNVMDGDEQPLPEWDDWGDLFMAGLKIFVILLIWAIPLIIVSLGSSIPYAFVEEGSEGWGLVVAISSCCGCLSFLLGIALALIEPVITFRFARSGEFASGFEFGKIFRLLGDNIANIIITVIIAAVAGFVLVILGGIVGTILLVVGLFVTFPVAVFLAGLIEAHLYGQVGREAEAESVTGIDESGWA